MKIKNIVLGLGIIIVYMLALHQGMETFYPTPEYEDYCDIRVGPIGREPGSCQNVPELTIKAEQCYQAKGEFVYEYDSNGCPIDGYCDDCRIDYEAAVDVHSSRVFIVALIIGVVVFVVGLFLLATEPVGSALMASGILSVFYGVVQNWRNFTQAWRFLLLFVLLIILIWVALRFNDKRKKFGFKGK
ncbi:MAG: hypothetical protein AABY16_02485 [Nanoarchaeota archaeon]